MTLNMSRPIIYMSGMRTRNNKSMFSKLMIRLIVLGYSPYNPLLSYGKNFDNEKLTEYNLSFIILSDAVISIGKESPITKREVELAWMSSIPVFSKIDELNKYFSISKSAMPITQATGPAFKNWR